MTFTKLLLPYMILLYLPCNADEDEGNNFHSSFEPEVIWAIPGKDVELPCDVTPEGTDELSMVLWFKGAAGIPLYSLDARDGMMSHWAVGSDLGSRTYFLLKPKTSPGILRITRVVPDDEGIYRCRVDFVDSPTRNTKFNVSLIVEPSILTIYDHQGRETAGVAGPYLEGYDLFFSCHVVGGRPRPNVTWWNNGVMVDDSPELVNNVLIINHFSRANVSRDLYNSRFQCQAAVSALTPPKTKEISVEIFLKPKKVEIRQIGSIFSAGRPQQYQCESWGSVPAAKITWLMHRMPAKNVGSQEHSTTNSTISIITFRPKAEDDGMELTCRAENLRFPGSLMEETTIIDVHYPPVVSVQINSVADLQNLREGESVKFGCKIRAKPDVTQVAWFHGDLYLSTNESTGVLITGSQLALANLSYTQAGEYSCAARNSEGEARSLPVTLRIRYAPVCSPSFRTRTVAALRHNTVQILCRVVAEPADVKFRWTFNSSNEVLAIPQQRIMTTNDSLFSYIEFKPASEKDFGTLACWGSNSAGFQTDPCVTHIVPARIPQSPNDCSVSNTSTGGLEVFCRPGNDGGLQQHFLLEAIEASSLPYNITGDKQPSLPIFIPVFKVLGSEPTFVLQGLNPGEAYHLFIYAANAKGKSYPPTIISYVRVKDTSSRLVSTVPIKPDGADVSSDSSHMSVILGSIFGITMLLLCIGVTMSMIKPLIISRKRRKSELSAKLCYKYETAMQETQEALQRQEDAFVIKIPLSKVLNDTHQRVHDVVDVSLAPQEAPAVQTVVLRRSSIAVTPEYRNSSFHPRSSVIGSGDDNERKSLVGEQFAKLSNRIATIRESPKCAGPQERGEVAEATSAKNESRDPELAKTAVGDERKPKKPPHPHVTLNPEGEVLRCVISSGL